MIITTDWLKEQDACSGGMDWFSMQSETDGRAVMESLISAGKLEWANWLIARMLDHTDRIRYAVFAAEQVLDIFEKQYPGDKRPRLAIEAARMVIKNDVPKTRDAALAAGNAAGASGATGDAGATEDAAWAAAWAAGAAGAAGAAWAAAGAAGAAGAAWAAWATRVAVPSWATGAAARATKAARATEVPVEIKIIRYGISLLEGK